MISNLVSIVRLLFLVHEAVHQKGQNWCDEHDISRPKHHVEIFVLPEKSKITPEF
jgi:hypothetical protein